MKDTTRLTDTHWVVLREIHANLALLLTASFTRKFDQVVEVEINDVQKTAYADFITGLSNPSFSYQFLLKPTHGGVILNFSNSIASVASDLSAVTDKANDRAKTEIAAHLADTMNPVEIDKANDLAKGCFNGIEAVWRPVVPVEIESVELEPTPMFMNLTSAAESVAQVSFDVNMSDTSGLISLCYPYSTLECLRPYLDKHRA